MKSSDFSLWRIWIFLFENSFFWNVQYDQQNVDIQFLKKIILGSHRYSDLTPRTAFLRTFFSNIGNNVRILINFRPSHNVWPIEKFTSFEKVSTSDQFSTFWIIIIIDFGKFSTSGIFLPRTIFPFVTTYKKLSVSYACVLSFHKSRLCAYFIFLNFYIILNPKYVSFWIRSKYYNLALTVSKNNVPPSHRFAIRSRYLSRKFIKWERSRVFDSLLWKLPAYIQRQNGGSPRYHHETTYIDVMVHTNEPRHVVSPCMSTHDRCLR